MNLKANCVPQMEEPVLVQETVTGMLGEAHAAMLDAQDGINAILQKLGLDEDCGPRQVAENLSESADLMRLRCTWTSMMIRRIFERL